MSQPYPLISVAVCTYNGQTYIREQLESIIHQTYPNKEIIVLDDKSSDNTVSILKEYEYKGLIRLIQNEKNLGFIKNFEKAVTLCNGDYIALSDQDDIWDFNKLSILQENIGDNLLIYHDSELIDSNGKTLNKKVSDYVKFVKGDNNKAFLFLNCVSGHASLFKKELTNYIFPIPDQLFHDWWIAYAATTIGRITYLNDCLVRYRQHQANFTDMLQSRKVIERKVKRSTQIASLDERKERNNKIIEFLKLFYNFRYNKESDKLFIKKLMDAYQKKEKAFFCFELYFLLMTNLRTLFHIDKYKWGRAKVIYQDSVGIRLKNDFHHYKKIILNNLRILKG